jgi:hypothetical protein
LSISFAADVEIFGICERDGWVYDEDTETWFCPASGEREGNPKLAEW